MNNSFREREINSLISEISKLDEILGVTSDPDEIVRIEQFRHKSQTLLNQCMLLRNDERDRRKIFTRCLRNIRRAGGDTYILTVERHGVQLQELFNYTSTTAGVIAWHSVKTNDVPLNYCVRILFSSELEMLHARLKYG